MLRSFFLIFLVFFSFLLGQGQVISGWGSLSLGSTRKDIIMTIQTNYPWIELNKNSFNDIPSEVNNNQLSAYPNKYLKILQLQFYKDKLYLIRIVFSKKFFSYITLYDKLKKQYGKPSKIKFKNITWENEKRVVILERDNVLKYIDYDLFPSTNTQPHQKDQEIQTSVSNILKDL